MRIKYKLKVLQFYKMQITTIQFCHENKIPFFYCNIKYKTINNVLKKNITGLPTGYMNMSYEESQTYSKKISDTHINIIIKKSIIRKLIVIDTDSQNSYDFIKTNSAFPLTAETKNILRPGHAHLYYEIDELPKCKIVKTFDKRDIDLIIDNIFETIDSFFEMYPTQLKFVEIMPIFKGNVNDKEQTNIINDKKSTVCTTDMINISNEINNMHNELIDVSNEIYHNSNKEPDIDFELAKQIICGLNYKEFEKYNTWIALAYCIYNISITDPAHKDGYFNLFNNFLKPCKNYNELENFKFYYQTAHDNKEYKKKVTAKSLWYWLLKQNKDLYNKLILCDMPNEMINPDFFAEKFKNNYQAAKQYFEILYIKLNNPACYVYYDNINDEYTFKSEKDMLHITKNFWYKYTNEKGVDCKQKFFSLWTNDLSIKTYNYIKLVPPPKICNSNTLNLFTGFHIEKIQNCEIVSIVPIIEHIKLLCEDSIEYTEYVLNFLAHIIQKPAELTRTALVFKGSQGAGKGMFFSWFATNIIGKKYYYTTADATTITVNNDHLNGKLLVNLDEANSADMYSASSNIKNKITEPFITLQNKYVKPFVVENYCRYIFFSNQEFPVKVEASDRRFVIFKTCDKISKLMDTDPIKNDYFKTLINAMNDINVQYSFFKMLQNRNINNINWGNRSKTESYIFSRELNIPIFVEFIEKYCWDTENIVFENHINTVTKSEFFNAFNKFLERTKNNSMSMKERNFNIECKKHSFISEILLGPQRKRYLNINKQDVFTYLKNNNFLQQNTEYDLS